MIIGILIWMPITARSATIVQTHGALALSGPHEVNAWSTFPADTQYFGPVPTAFMGNYRVKGLGAMLAQFWSPGDQVEDRVEVYDYGRFGQATDQEGNWFQRGAAVAELLARPRS